MRPLRLLLSLATSLVALTFLLYIALGSHSQGRQDRLHTSTTQPDKGKLNALFSFTSPASLFPPSAIISLTDDNSTFFLARPAAFGPALPSKGLKGPLWVGSGFGEDAMGTGELGCSDVPGWSEGDNPAGSLHARRESNQNWNTNVGRQEYKSAVQIKRTYGGEVGGASRAAAENDGTDDYLHLPISGSSSAKVRMGKMPEHADIQSLQEGAEIAGKVVLLRRGGCGFLEKVKWGQRRGGIAVIVGDNTRGGGLVRMYASGDTSNITIPAIFTSHTTAQLLSSLLPSGDYIQGLSSEEAAKLQRIKNGRGNKQGKKEQSAKGRSRGTSLSSTASRSERSKRSSWWRSFFGSGGSRSTRSKQDTRRPPSSGNPDLGFFEDWDDDHSVQKPIKTKATATLTSTSTTTSTPLPQTTSISDRKGDNGRIIPGSGEYTKDAATTATEHDDDDAIQQHKSWLGSWLSSDEDEEPVSELQHAGENIAQPSKSTSSEPHIKGDDDTPDDPEEHEGLWVTLTPTNMSSSPFFDTLLVLVVSPLITLTVVYALLLIRSRIRRRRWRAPKSVVERLPVRTYHTISDSTPTPAATPASSSPTTPLLQHTQSRPISSPRPRSRTSFEGPATSSSFQNGGRTPEEEKREAGLAEWRRRYGGRQKECVVCLEEYVDGVSRVMSLPCGHEFHEECITPWLVTRRRTCPICKGDVVRSLSQSYRNRNAQSPSPTRSPRLYQEDDDSFQAQAAETRNDSASASRPLPATLAAALSEDMHADVEANWADDSAEDRATRGRDIPRDQSVDLSNSVRDFGSSVATTIWRGVDAVRGAAGFQRRPSREEVDRDR